MRKPISNLQAFCLVFMAALCVTSIAKPLPSDDRDRALAGQRLLIVSLRRRIAELERR